MNAHNIETLERRLQTLETTMAYMSAGYVKVRRFQRPDCPICGGRRYEDEEGNFICDEWCSRGKGEGHG